MTTQPLTDHQLDEIEAKAAELRERLNRKNPWPSDNESFWTAEGWKSGTRNALDKLHVDQLLAEVRRLRQQKKILLDHAVRKDARSGEADKKLREFLGADEQPHEATPTPLTDSRNPADSHEPILWNDADGNLLAIYPGCVDDQDRPTVALEVREPVFNGFFRVPQNEMLRLAADLCASAGSRDVSEALLACAADAPKPDPAPAA